MKCPNCEEGYYKKYTHNDDWVDKKCPDCRGTGEIQEGDWWFGEVPYSECKFVAQWLQSEWRIYSGIYSYLVDIFKPLYRMEKAK